MRRKDGSIQSSNLPAHNKLAKNRIDKDYGMYRCMITKVHFVDDPQNTTFLNRQVTYEAIILGGPKEGQILQNVKAMSEYGGQYNFSERIYRPISTKNIEDLPISEHVGDIVFIQFLQGNTRAPVIVGAGVQPQDLDFTGSTLADGFVDQWQYNGIYQLIDKNGNFLLQRKGGSLDPDSGVFIPDQDGNQISMQMMAQRLSFTFGNGMVAVLDGTADSVQIKTKAAGEINIVKDRIAIGNGTAELFQQLSDTLQKLITFMNNIDSQHVHVGNLGYETSIPVTSSDFTQLGSDLSDIKALVDAIKGSL